MTEQKTADFRRFTPSSGDSRRWSAQATAETAGLIRFCRKPEIFTENSWKPQIGVRHLRSVTLSAALSLGASPRLAVPIQHETTRSFFNLFLALHTQKRR